MTSAMRPGSHDRSDDDRSDEAPSRLAAAAGFVRIAMVAVLAGGLWLALANARPDTTRGLRTVLEVPVGFEPVDVIEPDLAPVRGARGTWSLLGPTTATLDGDEAWAIVACRATGDDEVGLALDIVAATLGTAAAAEVVGSDDLILAAANDASGRQASVAVDTGPEIVVTVIGRSIDAASVARDVHTEASREGCDVVDAAAITALPERQRRRLDVPILPRSIRTASSDGSTVAWRDRSGSTIVLSSVRLGDATSGSDADLSAFFTPPADATQMVWVADGVLHSLGLEAASPTGADPAIDLASLAATVHVADVAEWVSVMRSSA